MASTSHSNDIPSDPSSLVGKLKATTLSTSVTPSWSPSAKSLPTTLSRSYEILSVATDCWAQLFSDRIVLGVSQLNGRIGTYISCQAEESIIDESVRFTISTLLGNREDDMLGVYARRVMDRIMKLRTSLQDACPPILLAVSLKPEMEKDPAMFNAIVDVLLQLYQEAIQLASSSA